jgi:ABC-type multidrug transport system permease subunit
MANSKKIKSIVICLIAAVVGIIALSLIFVDFGWGQQMPHIWAKIVPGIFTIIGIAIITYIIIESQNES